MRAEFLFEQFWKNTDAADSALARRILAGRYTWLEKGVVGPSIPGSWIASAEPGTSQRRKRPPPHRLTHSSAGRESGRSGVFGQPGKGRRRIRTHSSVSTTIAPASRSSATARRFARMMADWSAARRPTRRRISSTDGPAALDRASKAPKSVSAEIRMRSSNGRGRARLGRLPPAYRDHEREQRRALLPSSFRQVGVTGCYRSGTSCRVQKW